jgi:hypothetical protein
MKFTLKDYQDEAVRAVLVNLGKARKRWHEDGDRHAFSLSALTGAGKTVMAAAVFEALFYGDDDRDFAADPSAVVIWFSDDPALNEQTRFRLMEASDRIRHGDLDVVTTSFNRDRFQPGRIYFLNTQKLGKNSLLVRGYDPAEDAVRWGDLFPALRPDGRDYTLWDTIKNTIEDPRLTLYLVLDEAHRGMGTSKAAQSEKSTIVQRLINGAGAVPAIPVVWGISATVERFNQAMAGAQGRSTLPHVTVDAAKVQASGLLKDTIILDIPKAIGPFDTVLMRRATDKLKASNAAWADYAAQQDDAQRVVPLMVLQVPNTPDPDDIGRALDSVFQQWPDLPRDAIAHVFGEHSTQIFGGYRVPYLSPERVQDATWVRVLIAKDAISTGWDCPRAEVMVSFRPARDRTHITQLLGRMVRTPLARRIPGDDRLNAVDCLLPFFDEQAVTAVAVELMQGGGEEGAVPLPGRRVLINPREMTPNPAVPEVVWEAFLALPSQALPQRGTKPVNRLTALAHELAADGLLADAGKKAHAQMHKVLDSAQVLYADEIKAARQQVLTVEGRTLTADLQDQTQSFDDFWEAADLAVIEDVYRRAKRSLSAQLADSYIDHLAPRTGDQEADFEALMAAHAEVAALGLVPEVKTYVEAEADKLAKDWLTTYRVAIKALSDARQEVYRLIKGMSTDPTDIDLSKPKSWMEATHAREADGTETPLPTYPHHLLCDADGAFPAELNAWERDVLQTEKQRQGFIAWYRNPSRSSQDSLGIAYADNGQIRILRPDFLFFAQQTDGTVVADIVDPHGTQFSDALPKLKGLARYAETHPEAYRRIEAVAEVGGTSRVLDLTDAAVRHAVREAADAVSLYKGAFASDY